MDIFFSYLIQVNLILILLYAFYKIGLQNSSPKLDRLYLIGSVAIAFVFPLIQVSVGGLTPDDRSSIFILQNIPAILANGSIAGESASLNWYEWLYLIPVVLMVAYSLYSILQILVKAWGRPRVRKQGYTLVFGAGIGPASFGKFLFWEGEAEFQEDGDRLVLAHELGHIRQGHTYDLFLFEALRAICWFNPIVYLMHRELRQTHEFLADAEALNCAPREDLARLIAAQALGVSTFILANHFSSHTQKRLLMLKRSDRRGSKTRYLLAIPLIAMIFCSTSIAQHPAKVKSGEATENPEYVMPEVLNLAEVQTRIGYPKEAAANRIEGKVIVGVVVDKNGNVENTSVLSEDAPAILIKAVTAHVNELKFKPGTKDGVPTKTKVSIPFKFELEKKTSGK